MNHFSLHWKAAQFFFLNLDRKRFLKDPHNNGKKTSTRSICIQDWINLYYSLRGSTIVFLLFQWSTDNMVNNLLPLHAWFCSSSSVKFLCYRHIFSCSRVNVEEWIWHSQRQLIFFSTVEPGSENKAWSDYQETALNVFFIWKLRDEYYTWKCNESTTLAKQHKKKSLNTEVLSSNNDLSLCTFFPVAAILSQNCPPCEVCTVYRKSTKNYTCFGFFFPSSVIKAKIHQ